MPENFELAADARLGRGGRPSGAAPTPLAEWWSKFVATGTGAYAVVVAVVTLCGWAFNIPRLTDWNNDGVSMFPNAAVCAGLTGLALVCNQWRGRFGGVAAVRLFGGAAALVGALTLLQHITGVDWKIDAVFFDREWGQEAAASRMRMGPPASLSFLLLGVAAVLSTLGARARGLSSVLGIAATSIAAFSFIGYLYGAPQMYMIPWLSGIARQTASLILVLGVGLAANVPDQEPMRAIMAPGAAGKLARRALPLLIVISVTLGWVRVELQTSGYVDTALGTSLRTLVELGLLLGLLSWAVVMVRSHENALRESRGQLRRRGAQLSAFVETAAVALRRIGPDGTILWANDAELKMFGYRAEEYIGHPVSEFYPDQREISEILERLRRGEELLDHEARMRCKDGLVKTVVIDSSVLRDEDGRFLHTQCFTRDVTESRKAGEVRARLAAIVETSDDAIVGKTLDGIITSWNRGAERLFERAAADAIGQSIEIIVPIELRGEEVAILQRLRRGERIEHFETVRVTGSGRRVEVAVTVSPIRDGSGRIVGASKIARDITERRRAERELAESARRKDDFVAMLAHELRNPLAPISNALEMLSLVSNDPERLEKLRAMMQRQLRHMVRLVDDLLDASRISRDKLQLQKERLELGASIKEAVESCRSQVDAARVQLDVSLPDEPIHLEADPVRLVQVVCNILGNAAKYTDSGGRVSLVVTREDDGFATIRVTDTGIGIPEEMLASVFEMFTQVDRSLERMRGGLGIGLALARRLVELHGGTLVARSEGVGRGSEFTARFPVLPVAEPVHEVDRSPKAPAAVQHRRRVLVVDDNRDAATSLALLFKLSGSEAEIAYDGLEAVEKARDYMPDVVLLDIGLPNLNGFEVCREIRNQLSENAPLIVALTGWGQDTDRQRSREAGFDAHMVKPVDFVALTELLNSMRGNGAG